jgi:anti-anti-sigma factor
MGRANRKPLEVSVLAAADHSCFLGVAGELDLASTSALTEAVERVRSEDHLSTLTIDLAQLEFIDSTGLACLLQIAEDLAQANQSLRVIGASGQVQELFVLTGADKALAGR